MPTWLLGSASAFVVEPGVVLLVRCTRTSRGGDCELVDHVVAEVCVGERGAAGDGEWRAHCVVLEIDRVAGQSCVICGGQFVAVPA